MGITAAPESEQALKAPFFWFGKCIPGIPRPWSWLCVCRNVWWCGDKAQTVQSQTLPLLTQGTAFHLCKSCFPSRVGPMRVMENLGQLLVEKRKPQRAGEGIVFSSGLLMSGAIQRSLLG